MKTRTVFSILVVGLLGQVTSAQVLAQHVDGTNAEGATLVAAREAERAPFAVIIETIRTEVERQLNEAGATFDKLRVTVGAARDSGTPFTVSYRGLRNFQGSNGRTPEPDGEFIMHYVGRGVWQGRLAGVKFTVPVGSTDNIDVPFVNDPSVIGEWDSVDFVREPAEFKPRWRHWRGELYLKTLTFLENGGTANPWLTWTRGLVLNHVDKSASRYEIMDIKGQSYLFFEWKSGDVMIAGMRPQYYVLEKRVVKAAP